MFIEVDGTRYTVVLHREMRRSFRFVEGENFAESIARSVIFDTIGTEITYELEIDPHPTAYTPYDDLYLVLTSPNRVHHFKLPDTTDPEGYTEFDGYVESGNDYLFGEATDIYGVAHNRWHRLNVKICPVKPQRMSANELRLVSFRANNATGQVGSSLSWTAEFASFGAQVEIFATFYRDGVKLPVPLQPQVAYATPGQTVLPATITLYSTFVSSAGEYTCSIKATSSGKLNSVTGSSDPITVVGSST